MAKQIVRINMVRVSRAWTFYTMPRRAADKSTTSQAKKSRRLTIENDAPSSERELKNFPNDSIYSNILNLGRVTDQQDVRPSRSNRGKGGAIAQLQAVSDRLHEQRVKNPGNNVLQDVPINKMAPSEKGHRTVVSFFILLLFTDASIPGECSTASLSC